MLAVLLILTIVTTSFISGVLGMAGGLILMGVFTLFLSPVAAMILHGATQWVSNGSRALLHRRHIEWSLVPPYVIGALAVTALFFTFHWVAAPEMIFLSLGVFSLLGTLLPKYLKLDLTKTSHALLCGFVVTGTQLIAGASGPILDVFYINSPLNRFQIIASKALTQTLGHSLKLIYYSSLWTAEVTSEFSLWLIPMAAAAAVLGTHLGKKVLMRFSENQFQWASRFFIVGISLFYLAMGAHQLVW